MKALLLGAGGLGGPAALSLVAAGVEVTIADPDRVDPTNLSRQIFFGDADVGAPKADTLAHALRERFPLARAQAIDVRFSRDNAAALARGFDLVLDATDNFPTRFLANDVCARLGLPLIHGAALGWLGQVLAIAPGRTPCLRCVFEGEPPVGEVPACAQAGVISPLVGVVGGWMAQAALAIVRDRALGRWANAMRTLDGWSGVERWVPVGRDPLCPACGLAREGNRALDREGAEC